jgi:hypothetical protein
MMDLIPTRKARNPFECSDRRPWRRPSLPGIQSALDRALAVEQGGDLSSADPQVAAAHPFTAQSDRLCASVGTTFGDEVSLRVNCEGVLR